MLSDVMKEHVRFDHIMHMLEDFERVLVLVLKVLRTCYCNKQSRQFRPVSE